MSTILLCPRPYASLSGRLLLLPLLPHPKPVKPLPSEIWTEIFSYALTCSGPADVDSTSKWQWSLLTVCKSFKDTVLPLIYAHTSISLISGLFKFHKHLRSADQKWDSIRRIPYSTPGRWVQSLDLSTLSYSTQSNALLLDSLLTDLFPLLPFLSRFSINPSFILSRRALASLAGREGSVNIRALDGLSYVLPPSQDPKQDPFVLLLQRCPNIEELDIIGQGPDPAELELNFEEFMDIQPIDVSTYLFLPKLRLLSILSMHTSPLMLALLHTPLPSLHRLTLTPYNDIPFPASLVTAFITSHSDTLRSLLFFTPKSWPTRLRPSPDNMLTIAPNLRHLSLEKPLPVLTLSSTHNLQILSIPRPSNDAWSIIESVLTKLPRLSVIRIRDVRWLRRGMTSMAQEAGVQGEMREWRRRLARRDIRFLDADWNE